MNYNILYRYNNNRFKSLLTRLCNYNNIQVYKIKVHNTRDQTKIKLMVLM